MTVTIKTPPDATIENRVSVNNSGFDYIIIDPLIAAEARLIAEKIRFRLHTSVTDTGNDLIAAKSKLPHGSFGAWIRAEFGMSDTTAQNYMNAARFMEGKSTKFGNLPPSAIYALAAPSAPAEVVDKVMAEVEAGTLLSVEAIRERLTAATKARALANTVKSAEQIKRDRNNEKRHRLAEQERRRKFMEEEAANNARRGAQAEKVACLLMKHLHSVGVLELMNLMCPTDWYRVERIFDPSRNRFFSVENIEKIFALKKLGGEAI